MTWRELWKSTVTKTVTNLKALLGISLPQAPPPSALAPPVPVPKRKLHALTGPVTPSEPTERSPQTIDLTPSRPIPPPSSPLRTRKEPKVPAHIAREVAAFAAANESRREEKLILPSPASTGPAPVVDLAWPRQGLPVVAQTQTEGEADPLDSDAFDADVGDPSDGGDNGDENNAENNEEDDEGVALTTLLESLLFVAAEPVEPIQLARTLELSLEVIEQGLAELADYYQRSLRGLRVQRFNNKVQLVTTSAAAPFIEIFLNLDNTTRLSAPALETLAVIAYRQPVTRAQIESVRGVDCAGVLRSLVQRGLVADVGRMEAVGRPILYGVTELFMQHFGLMELDELPPLAETEADQLWAATVLAEQELDEVQHDRPQQSERK